MYFCILTALKMNVGHRNSIAVKAKELLTEFQSWLHPLTSSDFEAGLEDLDLCNILNHKKCCV